MQLLFFIFIITAKTQNPSKYIPERAKKNHKHIQSKTKLERVKERQRESGINMEATKKPKKKLQLFNNFPKCYNKMAKSAEPYQEYAQAKFAIRFT